MSRSGYSDDLDNWDMIRWRGAVESAIKGRRGQALLKELEAALLALPEKALISREFANSESGQVCALGAVALKRKMDKGMDMKTAISEIEEEFPEGTEAEDVVDDFDVADALVKEITFINDEWGSYGQTDEQRYESVLGWVRSQIVKAGT